MGQIQTNIGLISGINFGDIIDQLIALEERPKARIEQRNAVLQSQQTALQEVSAGLLGLQNSANQVTGGTLFKQTTSASSDESVLTVSSGPGAVPGNYTFRVQQLVAAQQTVTKGFTDTTTAVGPGTLTFDRVEARVDRKTGVDELNGGAGLSRGLIRITDRSGETAVVDLSTVVTVEDVVDRINQTTGVSVIAEVDGDRLTITDASGGSTATLAVRDVGTTGTATSLGLATTDADDDGVIEGAAVNTIGAKSMLAHLNDGRGINIKSGVTDLSITTADGTTHQINLDGAVTLKDVVDLIEEQSDDSVSVAVGAGGVSLELTDNTAGGSTFTIADGATSTAATDLGIVGSDAGGTVAGERIAASLNSKLLRNLNGGLGLAAFGGTDVLALNNDTQLGTLFAATGFTTSGDDSADLTIQARDDTVTYGVDVDALNTVGELINAVASATGGKVTLYLDDGNFAARDNTEGTGDLVFADANAADVATALGLVGTHTTSTVTGAAGNPDSGAADTADTNIRVTNSAGAATTIDLAGAESVSDVIDLINAAGAGVTASINRAGHGIKLTDTAGGVDELVVDDVDGLVALQLGLVGTYEDGVAEGANLRFRYVTSGTTLTQLGVTRGQFKIQDSSGATATVDLTQGNEVTIADVISEINSRGLQINARINDQGNGIIVEDTGPGNLAITITEDGSSTAADLGLLGAAATPGADLDGSFSRTVEIQSGDNLTDVAQKIADAEIGISASVINDGSTAAPFRLGLASEKTGKSGGFTFDDGGLGFEAATLSEGRDAVVFYGSDNPAEALMVTSDRNTLDQAIPGVTIDLLSTSDKPVQVTVSEDRQKVVDAVRGISTAFNSLIDTINKHDTFDAETEERGLLLGDPTVARVRSAIYNAVINPNTALSGQFKSLSQIGLRVGSGAKLQFDENKFREALETDPDAVEELLNFEQLELDDEGEPVEDAQGNNIVLAQGVGTELKKLLQRLTDASSGPVEQAVERISEQIETNRGRLERIDESLEEKRARLEKQFIDMERALAGLQDQSAALGQLQNLASQSRQQAASRPSVGGSR